MPSSLTEIHERLTAVIQANPGNDVEYMEDLNLAVADCLRALLELMIADSQDRK